MPAFSIHSATLSQLAVAAFLRTVNDQSDTAPHQKDALAAILFSAATCEAFMSELTVLTAQKRQADYPAADLSKALGQALTEAEDGKASIRLKFMLTKSMLTGKGYDRGVRPFQDFHLLFRLRDNIVHMKAEELGENPSSVVRELASKRLIEPIDPHVHMSWVDRVGTRAVAQWACNTAADMADSIIDAIRESPLGKANDILPFMLGLGITRIDSKAETPKVQP